MSLLIENYPDPTDSTTPIPQALAWFEHIQFGFSDGSGRFVLWVNRSPAAADALQPPADMLEFAPGDGFVPSLAEMMQDAEFATAFGTMRAKLYGWVKAAKFPTATEV